MVVVCVFFIKGNEDEPDYYTPKTSVHHTTTAPREKPKPKTKEKKRGRISHCRN